MTDTNHGMAGHVSPTRVRRGTQATHATRAPTPQACGCGLPVAFDVGSHEFFCIGCGGAKECTCRRSLFSSRDRPVNVV